MTERVTRPSDPVVRKLDFASVVGVVAGGAAVAVLGPGDGAVAGGTDEWGDDVWTRRPPSWRLREDWWHQLEVVAIEEGVPRGRLPKVTRRVGESPPQYVDWDEER